MKISKTRVYTNGAHIAPIKLEDGLWHWIVMEFEDDSYMDGHYVETNEVAETEDGLILKDEDDEDDDEEDDEV